MLFYEILTCNNFQNIMMYYTETAYIVSSTYYDSDVFEFITDSSPTVPLTLGLNSHVIIMQSQPRMMVYTYQRHLGESGNKESDLQCKELTTFVINTLFGGQNLLKGIILACYLTVIIINDSS